jgi:capsid assembly protease
MDSLTRRIELLTRSALWAIRPETVCHLLLNLAKPGPFSVLFPGFEAARPYSLGPKSNKVAVIPIQGVLTKDGPSWLGSNYDGINSALEQASADPSVKRIVLSVDSPGGEVTGLPETAAALASVAKVKPVSAMVEGMSASAAYWLTSQASDITLTPSGEVGSVGVRMMHVDVSKMLADMGYNVTELSSGNFKTEWSPFHPLTDEAKADMQTRLDAIHQDFLDAVTAGRGVRASQEIREARFGEGRMLPANKAVSNGMVDRLQASREFYKTVTPVQEEETPVHGLPTRRARVTLERKRF